MFFEFDTKLDLYSITLDDIIKDIKYLVLIYPSTYLSDKWKFVLLDHLISISFISFLIFYFFPSFYSWALFDYLFLVPL